MVKIGRTIFVIAGIMLMVPVTGIAQEDGPDHPPILGLMPPPGTEKPEGVEMSDDPATMMDQLVKVFFGMMDVDNSGELSLDELHAWVVALPQDSDMAEIRHLQEELGRLHKDFRLSSSPRLEMMQHMEEMHNHQKTLARRLRSLQEEMTRILSGTQSQQSEEGNQPEE